MISPATDKRNDSSDTPVFSIITVTRNSGTKLIETCRSVASQTVNCEYLIIDGNSSDGSRELAARFAQSDPRFILVSEPDRGIYDAMNKGIRLARGRYLYFLGAGDALLPDSLSAVLPELPNHDRGFIYGDVIFKGTRYDGRFSIRKLMDFNICHQAILYGREVFRMVGNYDLRYPFYADWEMNLRCAGRRSIETRFIDQVIAVIEPDGVSTQGDTPFHRDRARLILRHLGWQHFIFHLYRRCRGRVLWWRSKLARKQPAIVQDR